MSSSTESDVKQSDIKQPDTPQEQQQQLPALSPLPAFYISHGGGPCFFMDAPGGPFNEMDRKSAAAQWYRDFLKTQQLTSLMPDAKPDSTAPSKYPAIKNIILISAHWETDEAVHVTAKPKPGLFFDYYGFPDHTYKLQYPASGDPKLADRIVKLLGGAGISAKLDAKRDWDHGVFIPLKLMFPDANVPIVQVSLLSSLDPAEHIRIGQVLRQLRAEGSIIIGSGAATHNLGEIRQPGGNTSWAPQFVNWLTTTLTSDKLTSEQRLDQLAHFRNEKSSLKAHPREEHLIPVMVAAGAGEPDPAKLINDKLINKTFSFASFRWG